MLSLLVMEIRRLRDHMLMGLGMLGGAVFLFGQSERPTLVLTFFATLPIVSGMVVPINSFMQEERGNALVFLRSLPLRPWEIVAAKYVACYLAVLILSLSLLVVSSWVPAIPMQRILGQVTLVTTLSLCFCGTSYFLLFVFGLKRGRIVGMTIYLGAILLSAKFGLSMMTTPHPDHVLAFGATSLGPVVAVVIGTVVVAVSCLASAGVFTARDVSRMP